MRKYRPFIALVCLLLLAIGIGIAVIWSHPNQIVRPLVANQPDVSGATPADNPAAQRDALALPANQAKPDPAPVVPDGTPLDATPPEPERRVLVATDHDGKPVSLNFVIDWRIEEDAPWATQQAKTGEDGRAQLEAPLEATLRVNLAETGWVLGWPNVVINAGAPEARITAYAVLPLRVRVTYADGTPYVGLLLVKADKLWQSSLLMVEKPHTQTPVPVGWPSLSERGSFSFHEVVEFAGLPSGVMLTFTTAESRAGYASAKRDVSAAEVAAGAQIEIVVPEGVSERTPGKIVLLPAEGVQVEGNRLLFKILPDGT